MPSQLPAFSHDIFISYRHHDNRSATGKPDEGWVSEFVAHLSTELEAMVKGKVTIYFDKSSKDGLRENHQVEHSLNAQLESLIFIPILSQTYCDPESYAWKNEFIPFLEMAAADKVGVSVRLQNGNVAPRMMPVCIHDLEPSDIRLVESQVKGKLRAFNFVFKSQGINRPLRAREDDPLANANRTLYRDQINKVANAIREIVYSVRSQHAAQTEPVKVPKKNALLDGLMTPPNVVRSIAVLPLIFKAPDQNDEFLSQGFAEDLFSSLKMVKALRLSIYGLAASQNGTAQQHGAPPATMVLTGNMSLQEHKVLVDIRLTEARTETVVWQKEYECERDKLFTLRPAIILQICESLGIALKENERDLIQHQSDASAAALELYWKGRHHWRKRGNDLITSLECFQKCADLAPGFAAAHAGIANAAVLLGYYEMIPMKESISKCRESAMNALRIDPTVLDGYFALAFVSLCFEWNWMEAEHNFEKVFSVNPHNPAAFRKYKLCLTQILCNFEEQETEPLYAIPQYLQAYALMHKGKFEEGLKVAEVSAKKYPESFMAQRAVGLCYLGLGYQKEAVESLTMAAQLSNRHPWVLFDLLGAYAAMANSDGAQNIIDEAMSQVNALLARINDFYFQPG
jgi:TolB-like protein